MSSLQPQTKNTYDDKGDVSNDNDFFGDGKFSEKHEYEADEKHKDERLFVKPPLLPTAMEMAYNPMRSSSSQSVSDTRLPKNSQVRGLSSS